MSIKHTGQSGQETRINELVHMVNYAISNDIVNHITLYDQFSKIIMN